MKICTITCHDVYNHGASLQSYALMKYLKDCGHDVRIIDYKPPYLSNHYKLLKVSNPKWDQNYVQRTIYLTLKFPGRFLGLKRKRNFDKFTSKYLSLTENRYASNDELKKNPPSADAYFCGSDQIWNTLTSNGKDPAFFLDFVPEEKIKASYAASFATDSINDEIKPIVKERVNKLSGVGVREKSGVKILENLQVTSAVNVVDPVFLLEKEDWDYIAKREFEEDYVLIYDFDNSELIKKLALSIKNIKGYKIYSINPGNHKYVDKSFRYGGPEFFVSLIKNAKYVISNSFHAAVFSIIYEKDFLIINRKESINTRMRDLLDDINLNDRLIDASYDNVVIDREIDYKLPKKILKKKIEFSKQYIDNVLANNTKEGG